MSFITVSHYMNLYAPGKFSFAKIEVDFKEALNRIYMHF